MPPCWVVGRWVNALLILFVKNHPKNTFDFRFFNTFVYKFENIPNYHYICNIMKSFVEFVEIVYKRLSKSQFCKCVEEARAHFDPRKHFMAKHVSGVLAPLYSRWTDTYMDDEDIIHETRMVFCEKCGDKGCIVCEEWNIVSVADMWINFNNVSAERFALAVRTLARKNWKHMISLAMLANVVYKQFDRAFQNDYAIIESNISVFLYNDIPYKKLLLVKSAHILVCAELIDYMTGRDSTNFWMCATGTMCHPALLK